jgi:hypothetical protein
VSLSHQDKIEALTTLSPEEENILQQILDILDSSDDDTKTEMIQKLAKYPLRLLYVFSANSPVINELFETNEYCNESWSSRLDKMGYPYHPIQSFDGKIEVSLFAQMKGAHLLDIFDKDTDELHHDSDSFAILDKACDIGMYQAILKRLHYYANLLLTTRGEKKASNYVQIILSDVNKLSNLYWASGCIDSTLILFDIVNYYFQLSAYELPINQFFMFGNINHFSWMNKYDDNRRPYPIALLETATENLYVARLLSEFPESQIISDQLLHGEDLLAGFEQHFSSYEDLQKLVVKKLNALNVPLVETFCSKAYDHAVYIVHKQYTDRELPQELKM